MQEYRAHIIRSEDQVNNMDITQIDKINLAKFFSSPQFYELNNLLIELCKETFKEAYNKGGREAGAALDLNSMEYAYKKAKYYGKVSFEEDKKDEENNKCYEIMSKAKKCSCVTIHTHNDTSYFSVSDVMSLIKDIKVIAIVVITSKADVYVLCANTTKNYEVVEDYIDSMFEDYITPELRKIMEDNELFIRPLINDF